MDINTSAFFFKNFVGHMPEDSTKEKITQGMIRHYEESGLSGKLLQIYEACAKDEVLSQKNIPSHLWQEGNLVQPGRFYLHKAVKLMSSPPSYDFRTGNIIESPYYCEMREWFGEQDLLAYVLGAIGHAIYESRDKNIGAIRWLFRRYITEKHINALDMVLFLADEAAGSCKRIIDLQDFEEEVAEKIMAYRRRLEAMGKDKIVWRFDADEILH